jgi:hypothetical protein
MYKTNENIADRVLRAIVGIGLIMTSYYWVFSQNWQIGLYGAGGILILTALSGFCPIYAIFGANTTYKEYEGTFDTR